MLIATSMAQVIKIISAMMDLAHAEEIIIVRIKDRFISDPSTGGWRDVLLNVYFTSDPVVSE